MRYSSHPVAVSSPPVRHASLLHTRGKPLTSCSLWWCTPLKKKPWLENIWRYGGNYSGDSLKWQVLLSASSKKEEVGQPQMWCRSREHPSHRKLILKWHPAFRKWLKISLLNVYIYVSNMYTCHIQIHKHIYMYGKPFMNIHGESSGDCTRLYKNLLLKGLFTIFLSIVQISYFG